MFILFLKEGILQFYCKFNRDACNFTYADYTILFFFFTWPFTFLSYPFLLFILFFSFSTGSRLYILNNFQMFGSTQDMWPMGIFFPLQIGSRLLDALFLRLQFTFYFWESRRSRHNVWPFFSIYYFPHGAHIIEDSRKTSTLSFLRKYRKVSSLAIHRLFEL